VQVLLDAFKHDPCWSKETVDHVCLISGLEEAQVYKWGWDQKKKRG